MNLLGFYPAFGFCDTHRFWVFDKFRIKESPVPGISRTPKNHWVSWKNRQRPDGFRQIFYFILFLNHGLYVVTGNLIFFDTYSYLSTPSIWFFDDPSCLWKSGISLFDNHGLGFRGDWLVTFNFHNSLLWHSCQRGGTL